MAMVKIVNLSEDTDYLDGFNGQAYLIPAAGAELVPDGAMKLWLGDPAKRDVGKNQDRLEEFQRLQTRYGVIEPGPDSPGKTWDQAKPELAAYTMGGEQILTVIDDPTGRSSTSGAPVFSNEELSRMFLKEQAENARLREMVGASRAGEVDPLQPTTDMPPVDRPNRTQVSGKPKTPKGSVVG